LDWNSCQKAKDKRRKNPKWIDGNGRLPYPFPQWEPEKECGARKKTMGESSDLRDDQKKIRPLSKERVGKGCKGAGGG